MRFVALQSVICSSVAEPLGYPAVARSRCFQRSYRDLPYYRPPYPCEFGFILSCASASSEYVTAPIPHSTRRSCAPSLGFGSPSRHQFVKSTCRRGSHTRLCSALSVSHALDGFRLHAPCKLVSSCSHVRDSLFRGCFPLPSQLGSSPRCFPRVVKRLSPPVRLPWLSSSGRPNFRDLIRAAIRCAKQVV